MPGARGRAGEEEHAPGGPGPQEQGGTRAMVGARPEARRRLDGGQRYEEDPGRRAAERCAPEEGERIALGVARKLPVEEEEEMLVHHVVPREPRMAERR